MLKCLGDGLGDHGKPSKKCPAGRRRQGELVVFGGTTERETFMLRLMRAGSADWPTYKNQPAP